MGAILYIAFAEAADESWWLIFLISHLLRGYAKVEGGVRIRKEDTDGHLHYISQLD
jgi:hypothetical protein